MTAPSPYVQTGPSPLRSPTAATTCRPRSLSRSPGARAAATAAGSTWPRCGGRDDRRDRGRLAPLRQRHPGRRGDRGGLGPAGRPRARAGSGGRGRGGTTRTRRPPGPAPGGWAPSARRVRDRWVPESGVGHVPREFPPHFGRRGPLCATLAADHPTPQERTVPDEQVADDVRDEITESDVRPSEGGTAALRRADRDPQGLAQQVRGRPQDRAPAAGPDALHLDGLPRGLRLHREHPRPGRRPARRARAAPGARPSRAASSSAARSACSA